MGQSKGSWICREFHCPIMYIHLDAYVSVGVRMCQHPFLMFLFVCFLTERPGETSPFWSRDHHCFPFPGDTVLL